MWLRRMILPVILAIVALLSVTATAAQAAPYQYYSATSGGVAGASAFTQFNAAHSSVLISIESNHVACPGPNGAHVTWCGTIGNNTSHAQAGVNYTAGGGSYWMRMDVYAAVASGTGSLQCDTRGNAPSHFVIACPG